ncbi:MAG: outer membrane lipoprotein carrier protein LolA [Pyrinomonadaceae bacterium]
MKKLVSFGLVSLMLISSLVVIPQTANAQGAGLVSSILNKMERNWQDLHSLRSGLVMQKYNAQLKDFDMSFGELQYMPGAGRNSSVRVDWQKPQRETLTVAGGEYILFRPRLNMAYKGSTASGSKTTKVNSVLGFGLNASGAQLKSKFDVELAGEGSLEDGGPRVWMLRLTPKGGASYKFAEVWVDQSSGMVIQSRVNEKNGDSTLVRLTNVQKNARVTPDAFKQQLGSDVKIVKG